MKNISLLVLALIISSSFLVATDYGWVKKKANEDGETVENMFSIESGNLYTVTNYAAVVRVYKSDDNGNTWNKIWEKDYTNDGEFDSLIGSLADISILNDST